MKIRVCGLVNDSIVDGPGVRFSIFTQGCPHHCEGCHNPQSHDFDKGTVYDTQDIIEKIKCNPMLDGITLTGGEPFCQSEACLVIARQAHMMCLNVWAYSGYSYEELITLSPLLLNELDVLIDGPFVLAERSLELKYKGSKNQRLIDVKQTLAKGDIVLWEAPKWL